MLLFVSLWEESSEFTGVSNGELKSCGLTPGPEPQATPPAVVPLSHAATELPALVYFP